MAGTPADRFRLAANAGVDSRLSRRIVLPVGARLPPWSVRCTGVPTVGSRVTVFSGSGLPSDEAWTPTASSCGSRVARTFTSWFKWRAGLSALTTSLSTRILLFVESTLDPEAEEVITGAPLIVDAFVGSICVLLNRWSVFADIGHIPFETLSIIGRCPLLMEVFAEVFPGPDPAARFGKLLGVELDSLETVLLDVWFGFLMGPRLRAFFGVTWSMDEGDCDLRKVSSLYLLILDRISELKTE